MSSYIIVLKKNNMPYIITFLIFNFLYIIVSNAFPKNNKVIEKKKNLMFPTLPDLKTNYSLNSLNIVSSIQFQNERKRNSGFIKSKNNHTFYFVFYAIR